VRSALEELIARITSGEIYWLLVADFDGPATLEVMKDKKTGCGVSDTFRRARMICEAAHRTDKTGRPTTSGLAAAVVALEFRSVRDQVVTCTSKN
jgi:hypothetical protein